GGRGGSQRVRGRGAGGVSGGARGPREERGVGGAPGVGYLAQPRGRGDVWLIDAREPTAVTVERPVVRRGRLVWNDVQDQILDWIEHDGGGPRRAPPGGGRSEAEPPDRPPELPLVDGRAAAPLV